MFNRFIASLALFFTLVGCATHNTISDNQDSRLMLKGHDPVAYHTMGKPVLGQASIKAEHEGVTYRFINEENRKLFSQAPDKYKPQYNGFCSNGMVYAIPLGGNHDNFRVINGRLFMFGGESSKKYFEMDLERNMKLADGYWNDEVKGGSARLQAWRRLAFKVPHYKTNRELAADYEARQGKK
jgi:YHS domain-containing protein